MTKCVSVKYSTHDVLADVSLRQLVSHTITSNHSLAVHSEHISSSIHIYMELIGSVTISKNQWNVC